jgi:hypothetical protein
MRTGVLVIALALVLSPQLSYAQAPATTPELTVTQIKDFLKNAKITKVRSTDKGVTAPRRMTLSDGRVTHDAVFQAIDERQTVAHLTGARGPQTELNFVDSYKYNIAAYEIATLLGIEHMMPVYVERRWNGQVGSISWFVPAQMDESERLKKKIEPPRPADWNNQMYRMRVFSSLLRDTDRNLTNVLIMPDWKVMMIDFSRAFRLQPELLHVKDLNKIDRQLLAKIQALSRDDIKNVAEHFVTKAELDALFERRDLLVAHFKKLIAELGEDKVLY